MSLYGSQHRLSQRDCEALARARVTLDAIYDAIMSLNLSVKPILVQQLRVVHETVYELEKTGWRPWFVWMLKHGKIAPRELPPWFAEELQNSAPAAPEQSEEER